MQLILVHNMFAVNDPGSLSESLRADYQQLFDLLVGLKMVALELGKDKWHG